MIPMTTEPTTLSRFGGEFIKLDTSTQASTFPRPTPRAPLEALQEKEVMLRSGEVDVASEVIEQLLAVLREPGQHA
jgi:hypothetical protein